MKLPIHNFVFRVDSAERLIQVIRTLAHAPDTTGEEENTIKLASRFVAGLGFSFNPRSRAPKPSSVVERRAANNKFFATCTDRSYRVRHSTYQDGTALVEFDVDGLPRISISLNGPQGSCRVSSFIGLRDACATYVLLGTHLADLKQDRWVHENFHAFLTACNEMDYRLRMWRTR